MSVYRAHAENVHKYTRKGSRVGIDGRLQWREWETPDGQKHEAVSVVTDTVQFLGGAGEPEGREPEGREPEGEWVGEEIDEKPGRELVGTGAHAGEKGSIF